METSVQKNNLSSLSLLVYCGLTLVILPLFYWLNKYYFISKYGYNRFLVSPCVIILFAGLLLYYTFIILRLDRKILEKNYKKILVFFIIIAVILILLPTVTSEDVYLYIAQANIFNSYHENPYLIAPDKIFSSEQLTNIPATFLVDIYGPLWTIISIFLNLLSFNNIIVNTILLKINNLLFLLLTAYFLKKIAAIIKLGAPSALLASFLLNPLILMEVLLNAHNDIVMAFFLVLSIYFLCQQKYFRVLPCFTLAVLIKFYCFIFLPIILIFIFYGLYKDNKNWREITFRMIVSILLSLFFLLLAWLPFIENFNIWHWLSTLGNLFNHPLIYWLYAKVNWDFNILKNIFSAIFIVAYIIILWHLFKNKKFDFISLLQYLAIIFLIYIFSAFLIQPWYLVLILPILILMPNKKYFHYILNGYYLFLSVYSFLIIGL